MIESDYNWFKVIQSSSKWYKVISEKWLVWQWQLVPFGGKLKNWFSDKFTKISVCKSNSNTDIWKGGLNSDLEVVKGHYFPPVVTYICNINSVIISPIFNQRIYFRQLAKVIQVPHERKHLRWFKYLTRENILSDLVKIIDSPEILIQSSFPPAVQI